MPRQDTPSDAFSRAGTHVMGAYLALLAGSLVFFMIVLWPVRGEPDAQGRETWSNSLTLFGGEMSFETRLLLLVVCSGAIGSYIHSATSFATYLGNRKLAKAWMWWYLLRPFIGSALALLFYFVLRGGMLSAGASGETLSPFGIAAAAGLVGMFSKQATDKLREVADNLFRTAPGSGDDERKDKLDNAPVIVSLEPSPFPKDRDPAILTITGSGFVADSVVEVGGSPRATTFVSAMSLTATLVASDLTADAVTIAVRNPIAGTASEAMKLPLS